MYDTANRFLIFLLNLFKNYNESFVKFSSIFVKLKQNLLT